MTRKSDLLSFEFCERKKMWEWCSFTLDFFFSLGLKVVSPRTGKEFSKFPSCKRAINQDCQSNIKTLEQDVKHDIHPPLLLVLSSKNMQRLKNRSSICLTSPSSERKSFKIFLRNPLNMELDYTY